MKKGIALIAITMFFLATLFNSCSSKPLCPAYTDNQEDVEMTDNDA